MAIFNFNDLSKSAKIGYNALYNVILSNYSKVAKITTFTVPLCLNADNKVSLTEKNFIFFESVLNELKLNGYYDIVLNNGRAVEDVKTDFYTVKICVFEKSVKHTIPDNLKTFDFSDVDTTKLYKRDGKAEKAKTEENKAKTEEEKKTVEETSKALEEKTEEVEKLKKEVAKKEDQLNKKAIAEFNDGALFDIVECVERLIKKHIPMVPKDFDFTAFEADLMNVAGSQWDKKLIK